MFGIRPWDVERLRPAEFDAIQASLRARLQEVEQVVSMEDALEAAPVFEEDELPDPFRVPPRGSP